MAEAKLLGKKSNIIVYITVTVIIALLIVFWFLYLGNYYGTENEEMVVEEEKFANEHDKSMDNVKLNTGILEDEIYISLKSYGKLPVTIVQGETGRPNPFISY